MSNYVVLSPETHHNTRVLTEPGKTQADVVQFAMTHPFEFRNIQACYPIFFSKSRDTGEFFPLALFGFEQGENLFIDQFQWHASYIPMMIERQPFLIGYQKSTDGTPNPVVSIDTNSPKVSDSEGQRLFEASQPTDYLKGIMSKLEALHHGHEHGKGFITVLTDNDLLEPFTLDITLKNGKTNQLMGFYTINEHKLLELDGDTLGELNKSGYLQPIYMAIASYARIKDLIDKKNALSK
jgi:hypothetical protein